MAKYLRIKIELLDSDKTPGPYAHIPTENLVIEGQDLAEIASLSVWNTVEDLLDER